MATETEILTVEDNFTTVELLLWRKHRREYKGLLEGTLALNPGLARRGLYLPLGLKVVAPIPTATERAPRPLISLWTKAT